MNSRSTRNLWLAVGLVVLALVPRALNLTAYVAPDEAKWVLRSAHFLLSLRSGDFGAAASQVATPQVDVLAPAVTTMWTGAIGLLAKHWVQGGGIPLNDYLAALPYQNSDQLPLDFYPWTRFPTVIITALFVAAFYFLLRKLMASETIPLMAAILLALDPFFVNYSRVIHHDALVTVFMVSSLLLMFVYWQETGIGWVLLSGVMLGLAVATKPTSLFLILFVGLLTTWQIYQTRAWSLLGGAVLWGVVGLAAFVLVWPALWLDPGGTLRRLAATSMTGAAGDSSPPLLPALIPGRLPELGVLFYPVNFALSWAILPTLGLILLAVAWWRKQRPGPPQIWPTLGRLGLFSLLFMLALAPLATRDIRYFMPAWPALMVLAAAGLAHFKRWFKPWLVAAAAVILLIPYYPYYITYYNPLLLGPLVAPRLIKIGGGQGLDRAAAFLNSRPNSRSDSAAVYLPESFTPYFNGQVTDFKSQAFADVTVTYIRQLQNQHPSAQHLAYFKARRPNYTVRLNGIDYAFVYLTPPPRLVTGVTFESTKLVAQTLDSRYVEPGSAHQLTLLWQAPPDAAATPVWLQLRDAAGQVWLETEGPLIDPTGPSSVEGHFALNFPARLPRGNYRLRLAVGRPGQWQPLAEVAVRQFSPPKNIAVPLQIKFDDSLLLRGFDVSSTAPRPGDSLVVGLHWQTLHPMPRSYTNFVHLLDDSGRVVAQVDRIPGDGAWPTDTWLAGEWLSDKITLALPLHLPPGKYDLITGWYYWESGERLPVMGDPGSGDVAYLTTISIQ